VGVVAVLFDAIGGGDDIEGKADAVVEIELVGVIFYC